MRPGDEEWQLSVKITAKQNSFVGATSPLDNDRVNIYVVATLSADAI